MAPGQRRGKAWFLLPIFLGIFGGLAAYFVLRRSDEAMAKDCLRIGAASIAAMAASVGMQMVLPFPYGLAGALALPVAVVAYIIRVIRRSQ